MLSNVENRTESRFVPYGPVFRPPRHAHSRQCSQVRQPPESTATPQGCHRARCLNPRRRKRRAVQCPPHCVSPPWRNLRNNNSSSSSTPKPLHTLQTSSSRPLPPAQPLHAFKSTLAIQFQERRRSGTEIPHLEINDRER